ncbi:hypothetical protein XELAEV_18029938mg [Xenopus laevis]|uniref:Uncharacterized protein n=1 Tax=Xenopus laevis TaxID=8355 RepID=A0A974CSL6_XENLA|nr:hypothetical protein XELAEV_18029938mg [Xenopus laevis]
MGQKASSCLQSNVLLLHQLKCNEWFCTDSGNSHFYFIKNNCFNYPCTKIERWVYSVFSGKASAYRQFPTVA